MNRTLRGLAFLLTTIAAWAPFAPVSDAAPVRGRPVEVRNTGAVDDTLAVVIDVATAGLHEATGVVDETGAPIAAQTDDLDGDGKADEISFLLPVKARAARKVAVVSGSFPAPSTTSPWRIEEVEAGSWAPIRMQPTHSPGTTQHSTYLSPVNAERARRLIARLEQAVPMVRVACDDFRLLIGRDSGLIEAMQPAGLPTTLRGSTLREYLPEATSLGQPTRRFAGPVRVGFEWQHQGGVRRVTIYRNGLIESSWERAPSQVQVIVCAYPYRYVQTGPHDIVRYSQMLEKRRDLPTAPVLGFFGRRDAALRVTGDGLVAVDHQVWLDSGEIGWEVGFEASKQPPSDEVAIQTFQRMTRLTGDTYIGGGMHVTTWQAGDPGGAALRYRITQHGAHVLTSAEHPVKAEVASTPVEIVVKPPAQEPDLSLAFETTRKRVNRLHPNAINGWELRPITLAKRNPQAAYFRAALTNRSDRERTLELRLDDAGWIHEARVLSGFEWLQSARFAKLRIPRFRDETALTPESGSVAVTVSAGATMPLEVLIRPKAGTLGAQTCRLRWDDEGATDLTVVVKPTTLFMPKFAPTNDMGSELATVAGVPGSPYVYGVLFWGGYNEELLDWYDAAHRHLERHRMWSYEPIGLRGVATRHGEATSAGQPGLDVESWTTSLVEALRDPRFADYRARVYTHDEIWEVMGRKGHYVVPVDWMVDIDRRVVMNLPNAAWASFQEPAIDEPFRYHVKLPNDIAELFYYCGQDARLQKFAHLVVEPRRALFEQWRADPQLLAQAGTDDPRQIFSFWISTQLHVNAYRPVRRQIWWLRHHGYDAFNSWACIGHYAPYAARIMHWMLMPIGSYTDPNQRYFVVTDRSLAWMDMKEDMDLVTLVRLLREQTDDTQAREAVDALAAQALEASQRDDFDLARHHYATALEHLRPDLGYLAPRDHYQGPVEAEPLPDLFGDDGSFREAQQISRVSVKPLPKQSNRPAPTIDGILDNAYLEDGVTLELKQNGQGSRLKAATTAYLARDEDYLYIFFACREPNMDQRHTDRAKQRDDTVWATDCVEVFIDPKGDKKGFIHLAIGSNGVRYDSRKDRGGKAWNPEYEHATRLDAESWSVELRLPLAALGDVPQPGDTWRMNFFRERYAGEWELGAWSVTFGGFYNPERMGVVVFE